MELGLAIGVFIIVAIILLSLFCVITRYFNFKLKRALEEQAEIYSLIQGIQGQREDINQGQYQDFINKRIVDKKKRQQQNNKNYQLMLQMTQDINYTNQPLKDAGQNIYGNPKLKNKLNRDINLGEETGRSLVSAKNFQPDKFTRRVPDSQTAKSTFSKRDIQNFNITNKRKADITRHKSTSKLVCYSEQSLNIIDCKAIQLWKQDEIIKQRRKIEKTTITPVQLDFDESLQSYGFQKGLFQAYKYITTYQIVGIKPKQLYSTKNLKQSQQKQPIQFPSFYIFKDKLDEQLNTSSVKNSK